ncbi:smc2 [Symbiodinium pilosum]|uniref:Smc2 protein n=1 Tax=Symbiodinium pilosum TaxID=2952 RepID=A0A812M6T4_SYMPI|nr:smc2 [Symbiodinium pilosum]
MAPSLRLLSDCELGDDSAVGLEIAADLREGEAAVAQARERCLSRLAAEVLAPLDQRLATHEQVREAVRQRQRLAKFSTSARMDVAMLRKGEVSETGLRSLSGLGGPLEEAEARLKDDMQRASEPDEQVFLQLTQLKATSIDCIKNPWAALVQIQSEYFMAQQVAWAPLGEAFDDYGGLQSVRVT